MLSDSVCGLDVLTRCVCYVHRSRRLDEWLFPARARFDLENTSPRVKPALPRAFACDWTSLLVPTLTVCRTLDQINTGCTVCPGGTGRNSRVWLQVCIGCRVYVYVLRTALRVPEVCTFANNNRGLSTTQFHGRNASPSHSSHWMVANAVASATGGKGPWAKLSGRRARSARGFGG